MSVGKVVLERDQVPGGPGNRIDVADAGHPGAFPDLAPAPVVHARDLLDGSLALEVLEQVADGPVSFPDEHVVEAGGALQGTDRLGGEMLSAVFREVFS